MADEEKKADEEKQADDAQEKSAQKENIEGKNIQEEKAEGKDTRGKKSGGILPLIVMPLVVLLLGVSGFILGRLLNSGPRTAEAVELPPTEVTEQTQQTSSKVDMNPAIGWYYDLDPVATNLNSPGSTRYIRITMALEIDPDVEQFKGARFLDEQVPMIRNLLNIYFAGVRIEDIKSDKDMKRIQSQICDIFNEKLFPDSKPWIKQILFKEFGIQ